MIKSELIANLKENNRLHKKSESWFKTLIFIFFLCFILFDWYFKPEGIVFDLAGWIAVAVFIGLMVHDIRTEKNINLKTSMFCETCKERYDEETLAYAVLINECQNCKGVIYET